jgi:hypothetical protein
MASYFGQVSLILFRPKDAILVQLSQGGYVEMDLDSLIFNIGVFIAGIFVLDYGADTFIDHTVIVGRSLGVSQTIIAMLTAGAEYEEASQLCISVLPM